VPIIVRDVRLLASPTKLSALLQLAISNAFFFSCPFPPLRALFSRLRSIGQLRGDGERPDSDLIHRTPSLAPPTARDEVALDFCLFLLLASLNKPAMNDSSYLAEELDYKLLAYAGHGSSSSSSSTTTTSSSSGKNAKQGKVRLSFPFSAMLLCGERSRGASIAVVSSDGGH
jgi:hypothetical protein